MSPIPYCSDIALLVNGRVDLVGHCAESLFVGVEDTIAVPIVDAAVAVIVVVGGAVRIWKSATCRNLKTCMRACATPSKERAKDKKNR